MGAIGYVVSGPDNGSHMYRSDADTPRCPGCGYVIDHSWVDRSFALRPGPVLDVSFTYDGCLIVSDRFRRSLDGVDGAVFIPLPGQEGWFLLLATREVAFDSHRRKTRFSNYCEACGRFTVVAGATPAFVLDPATPLPDEVMRTDVEFGSGDELRPLVVVGLGVAERLRQCELSGLELLPIEQ